ncbi:histone deacetylase [Thraustotheca clavata]|uniref:Histone deacetylase n=1 Tax=Thraustotheca clavata TaxID=74557 RepID=A0A1V9YF11_9STRA|nr:histone deacetylase [Thraustotheca clavata]
METYRPGAVVLQCGADSLTGDRLGSFNLTVKGHGECVKYVKSFGLPMLVVGGGGYTVRNVSRAWAYETSVVLDEKVSNDIPFNEYFEYYAPSYKLDLEPNPLLENCNRRQYLDDIKIKVFEHLRMINGAPSVQMQQVPPDYMVREMDEDADLDKRTDHDMTKRAHEVEFYDNEKDQRGRDDNEAMD